MPTEGNGKVLVRYNGNPSFGTQHHLASQTCVGYSSIEKPKGRMEKKHITFGEVERKYCFGLLRRWEPLRMEWQRCRTHMAIQAQHGSNWLAVVKEIIDSVLMQNGRVLIVDRRSGLSSSVGTPGWMNEDNAGIVGMSFGGRTPYLLGQLHDDTFMDSFIDVFSEFDDSMRVAYIPARVAMECDQGGTAHVQRYVARAIHKRLGTPLDPAVRGKLDANTISWDDTPPVLMLTIGSSWYDDNPVLAAQLRAIGVPFFHVVTSADSLHPPVQINSANHLFLATLENRKQVQAEGLIRFVETNPKTRYSSHRVLTLFRMPA